MSASHTWIEWHLTPHGWVTHACAGPELVPAPPDRVLTCRYLEQRADFAGSVRRSLQTIWHCNDPDRIRDLMLRYGQFPPAEAGSADVAA